MNEAQQQKISLFTERLENAISNEDALGIEATFKAVVCMVQDTQAALEQSESNQLQREVQLKNALEAGRETFALLEKAQAERDRLREALKVAINTVECASIDIRTGQELPWHIMAREALKETTP